METQGIPNSDCLSCSALFLLSSTEESKGMTPPPKPRTLPEEREMDVGKTESQTISKPFRPQRAPYFLLKLPEK
jgi:hypothetical protein